MTFFPIALSAALSALMWDRGPGGESPGARLPRQGYVVERRFPHDPQAFTQGLFFLDGHLYESTGIEGRSTIRKVDLKNGKVLQMAALPENVFSEGMVNWKKEIISVTWRGGVGFRWDLATLRRKGSFSYSGEGWGLTQDGKHLILSDGTSILRFLDPVSLTERKRLSVTAGGRPVRNLNELEWVDGEILANVWQTNLIVRIDPATGAVKALIDLSGLDKSAGERGPDDVLNGIAYDKKRKRLFVTGKNWPDLYEIRVVG
jgi:glutamine cyclotransferase